MRSFRDTPIKQKLIAISLLSSGTALLLACAGFVAYDLSAYKKAELEKLASVAGVIAENSVSAIIFEDPESAELTLTALRAEKKIVTACIYREDGKLFAAYSRDPRPDSCGATSTQHAFEERGENTIVFARPITSAGESIGTIVVSSDSIDLLQRLARYGSIMGLVMLAAGLGSLPLASKLQRFISGPISRLVETSRHVSAEKDFSVRAVAQSGDEVGVLVGAFNEMLEQIEVRDLELGRHRENLEEAVEQRTVELKSVNQELKNQISQRENAEERIRYLAYYDGLTGLPNRQLFQERLGKSLATAKKLGRVVALLFLDLDRFKQVNDTLGHSVGDELLCEVAQRVVKSVRFTDVVSRPETEAIEHEVSRLGGDEFTVLLTQLADPQDAAKVASRMLEELKKPLPVGGYELVTTASIGIAVFPFDGADAETLLRNAETSMYHAKSHHRNTFEFYTEAMNTTAARKLHIANRLRYAMKEGALTLYYQPLRNAATGRLSGAEALLRWNDSEMGPVGPDEFIPIAEDTGLIIGIGAWVLRTACAQVRAWREAGYREIRIAINVSTHQLRQQNWVDTVAQTLKRAELSPAQVELEVTETAILHPDDVTISSLARLNEMGIGLALDDFGTGYSSLSYLRRFPIARVKIDRSFVGDITADPEDAALTTAILTMARSLRLKVVAEGVETLEQADFLRERGCDELQGYLLGRPVPPEEFERFLEIEKGEDSFSS